MAWLTHVAAYGAALVLTLCACSRLTPRAWWRRPNARALGVLGLGTAAGGTLLLALGGPAPDSALTPALTPALAPASALAALAPHPAPAQRAAPGDEPPRAGGRYRARDALNLRTGGGVGTERLLVLPAGAPVQATGRRDGDWWQVRAMADGKAVEGWASSLWLRRADEGRASDGEGVRPRTD